MNKFKDILSGFYDIHDFVPYDITGSLYISGFNNKMDVVVSSPGHIDADKWVLRFNPHFTYTGWYFDLGCMCEERFDTEDECIVYLLTHSTYIYMKMCEYLFKAFEESITEEYIKKKFPEAFAQFKKCYEKVEVLG